MRARRLLITLLIAGAAALTAGEPLLPSPPSASSCVALPTPDLACRVRDAHGVVMRSRLRRAMFLRMIGLRRPPQGYAVNHIVPLRCGGCDLPSNMELMAIADWRARTGPERTDCGRHPGGMWGPPRPGEARP